MKKSILILFTAWITSVFAIIPIQTTKYDPQFVITSSVLHMGEAYKVIYMRRSASGNRIKVKYFSTQDEYGTTVANRYRTWAVGKDIICLSSGGYMDNSGTPVGINVDNGIIVNRSLEKFDGLVIVYATGGVVASNIQNGDLTLQGAGIPPGKNFDIRNSAVDRTMFLNWCETQSATVFQTHLLAFKNELKIYSNSDPAPRERRFLAVGKEGGEIIHAIVHSPTPSTLYEGSRRTLEFLNSYKNMEVIFMINLDPGAQNVFFLFDENGNVDNIIRGTLPLENAANLIVYYYE